VGRRDSLPLHGVHERAHGDGEHSRQYAPQDELDLTPPPGKGQYQPPPADKLVDTLEKHVTKARESLSKTNDDFLMTTKWKLLAGGKVVMEAPRHVVLRDTLNHLAHHRGQLTVYLRLTDQTVPAIYGPSADDQQFA